MIQQNIPQYLNHLFQFFLVLLSCYIILNFIEKLQKDNIRNNSGYE